MLTMLYLCCAAASEVSQLDCYGPNRTDAMLSLTWDNPPGSNMGFEIELGNSKQFIPTCNPSCSFNFGLDYNTPYTVAVLTKGCGRSSSVKSISCKTGITGVCVCVCVCVSVHQLYK